MNYKEVNRKHYQLLEEFYREKLKNYPEINFYGFSLPNVSNIGDYVICFGLLKILNNLGKKVNIYYHFNKINDYNLPTIFRGGGFWHRGMPCWMDYVENINKCKSLVVLSSMSTPKINENNCFKNKDIVFCLRDKKSHEIFKSFFSYESYCLPDTSLGVYNELENLCQTGNKTLLLFRKDGEKKVKKTGKDWLWTNKERNIILSLSKEEVKLFCFKFLFKWLNNVKKTQSDRLHGFIIPVMMGKKAMLYPNNYHKNTSYYQTWGKDYDNGEYLEK